MKVVVFMLGMLCISMKPAECTPKLQLLQIVFTHKTYAPILDVIYSNDTNFPSSLTYEHFNRAPLGMPASGMLHMFNLGIHIRDVYDEFLGDIYMHETMKMQTTEYPLSMISAQLVNAGLWPPTENQTWSTDMNWQPIPTDYMIAEKDTLLLGIQCPNFKLEIEKVLNMEHVKENLVHHSPLFDHVSQNLGMKIQQPSEIALLYAVFETKADLEQPLPQWAVDIFPYGAMYNVSLLEYDLLWETPLQKKLNGGTILKEILSNSLMHIDGGLPKGRKLMMYSGNERNIVGILKGLNLWSPHIPNEASAVIFELYLDNETESHGMKINYYTGVDDITIPLTLPNCAEICPVTTFLHSILNVLPQNPERLCNWQKINLDDKNEIPNSAIYNRSVSHVFGNLILLTILLLITLFVH